ncbi:ATP-binding protein [Acidovorax sp. SUPP2539]|uniref:ATP-binding protein n=1 Tax=Acidovorax sp. SUPP2539 TaxID=2920878 RepID=UPI0024E045C2|nr:ATP-binding protein [Acidovorax sp. SUPP2539]
MNSSPDLTLCDREPIQIPGAIQSHGHMLVLDGDTLALRAWSANWAGLAVAALAKLEQEALRSVPPDGTSVQVGVLEFAQERHICWAHRHATQLIVECEPQSKVMRPEEPIYGVARDFLPKLQAAETVDDLTQLAAQELQRLTGFGRSLIYRFDHQGHGEVLAEVVLPGYDSYLGLRFPATDIPQQARALYLANRFRLIPDANYEAVPLLAAEEGSIAQGIDLSYAFLRSVSPVHLEYMRNMGTLASMSLSIVVDGKLWGLASCHHHEPRNLDAGMRAACSHLGQLLSMQIEGKQANAEVAARLELRKLTLQLVSQLSDSDASLRSIVHEPALLLRMSRATGAAVVLDDQAWTAGDTPATDMLLELAGWIAGMGRDVYESSELAAHFPMAAQWQSTAAGVLAISISQVHRHVILWFRPEIVQTVTWAGDPRKDLHPDAAGRIHPRRSFDNWVEQISGRCLPWSGAQVSAAGELRQALIGIVLRRAEELAAIASELGRVNKELEAFSYTVSHDLRAPMRHIAGYVDLVMDTEGKVLSQRAHRYMGHVKDAAAFAGQLVDALLDFSRMGRTALKLKRVDSNGLVEGLVREISRHERDRKIEWQVEANLPVLVADPLLLQVAVRNLIANAVKYSRDRNPAVVTVRAVRNPEGEGLEVQDNGVGFQMQYVTKLFQVFQRLHQTEQFEGTGIGLANVKRIVERHGGKVWAHGEPGQGASFGFVLPESGQNALLTSPIGNTSDHA